MLLLVLAATAALLFAFLRSAPEWSDVLSPVRNDLVFAERNRAYGAYRLRREHPRVLAISAALALGLALLVFFLPHLLSGPAQVQRAPMDRAIVVELKDFVVPSTARKERSDAATKPSGPAAKLNREDLPPIAVDSVVTTPRDTTSRSHAILAPSDSTGTDKKPMDLPPGGDGGTVTGTSPKKDLTMNEAEFAPEFPGGLEALYTYLGKNIRYPEEDRETRRQGRVVLGFVVDEQGNVTEITVLSGVTRTLDAEAVRVVQHMGRWKPGRHHGEAVRVSYQLPISFRLGN